MLQAPIDPKYVAYWISFSIPAVFILLRILIQRVIDRKWRKRHAYVGIDLSVFSLAATLVNIIDVAKEGGSEQLSRSVLTLALLVIVFLALFFQVIVHQKWETEERNGVGQTVWLCILSNFVGLFMLAIFVWFKFRHTI